MIWENTNQDSVIDDNDRIILGMLNQIGSAGFTNTITYKAIYFIIYFLCKLGRQYL